MRDDLPSWIASICSAIAVAVSISSKALFDPMLSVILSGILIICVGVTVIWGHILKQPALYQWFGDEPGMAIETAGMLIVIGAGKITMASHIRALDKASRKR